MTDSPEDSGTILVRLVRAEIGLRHAASDADIERLRTEIARLETKIEAVKTWTLLRMLGVIGLTTGTLVAIAAIVGAVGAFLTR